MLIEVLRHAKAHSRKRWNGGSDRERPLDDTGQAQARRLVDELRAGGPIAAIRTSPLVRCTETVAPLAAALGQTPILDERLAELRTLPVHDRGSAWVASAWLGGRALAVVDELATVPVDGRVVLCSHGDVIPALLATLVGRDGLALNDVRVRKGGRVTLEVTDGRVRRAVAVPPPRPAPVSPAAGGSA
ncbi:MAG: histidine phosphatase family protein [Actinomycetota bacterium]